MEFLLYLFALIGPVAGIGFYFGLKPRTFKDRALAFLVSFLFAYGWLAFSIAGIASEFQRIAFVNESVEMPVLFSKGAVENSRGERFLFLKPVRRIQVYDREGNFLRGWFVKTELEIIDYAKLHVTKEDFIEVFFPGYRFVYTSSGELVKKEPFPREDMSFAPSGPGCPLNVRAPFYLLPLAHPVVAWIIGITGMIGFGILEAKKKPKYIRTSDKKTTE